MRRLHSFLLTGMLVLLSGCQLSSEPAVPEQLPLYPPESMGARLQVTQHVTLTPPVGMGDSVSLLAAWALQPGKMRLVGMTLSGIPLLSMTYDGKAVLLDTVLPEAMEYDPRSIISQIQLAHWPLASLTGNQLWHVEATDSGRTLYWQGTDVLEIEGESGFPFVGQKLTILDRQNYLTLTVKTLSVSELQ